MSRPLLLAAGLLLGLAACAAPPPAADRPAFRVDTGLGGAYAHSNEDAEQLAEAWEEAVDELRAALPEARKLPRMEMWLLEPGDIPDPFGLGQPMGGVTYLVGGRPTVINVPDSDEFEWVLAHELTHALVEVSPRWSTLSGVMEEGICEWAGEELAPASQARRWLSVLFETPPLFGIRGAGVYFPFRVWQQESRRSRYFLGVFEGRTPEVAWTEEDFRERMESASLDPWPEERSALERLGYFLVDRIVQRHGIEGVLALCDEARELGRRTIGTDAALAKAGYGSYAEFLADLERAASRAEVMRILDEEAEELAVWFVSDLQRVVARYPGVVRIRPDHGYIRASDHYRRHPVFGPRMKLVEEMAELLLEEQQPGG